MNSNQLKLSFRNVTRQGKRSVMLGLAMGFGVLVTAIISSLTSGMTSSAVDNFAQALGGHVFISGEVVSNSNRSMAMIDNPGLVSDAINSLEVPIASVNYRSATRGTLSFGSQSISSSISGIDFENESDLTKTMTLVAGQFPQVNQAKTLIVPEKIAKELNVNAGEAILIKANTVSGQQNLVEWTIGAIIKDPEGFDQTTVYAPLVDVNHLLALGERSYQKVNLVLENMADMDAVATALASYFAEYASIRVDEEVDGPMGMMSRMMGGLNATVAEPWQGTQFDVSNLNEVMSTVMSLVGVLDQAAMVVFVVILLIIMVGISNSYRMVILERVEEIGTMRAMGAQRSWIFGLFISESVMIAFLGALFGSLAAWAGMVLLSLIDVSGMGPLQLFSVAGHLQFPVTLLTFGGPALITMFIAALAVYSPARTAARMAPGDALRATA